MNTNDWGELLGKFEQELQSVMSAEGSTDYDKKLAKARVETVQDAIDAEAEGELEPWFDLDQELFYLPEALRAPFVGRAPSKDYFVSWK